MADLLGAAVTATGGDAELVWVDPAAIHAGVVYEGLQGLPRRGRVPADRSIS